MTIWSDRVYNSRRTRKFSRFFELPNPSARINSTQLPAALRVTTSDSRSGPVYHGLGLGDLRTVIHVSLQHPNDKFVMVSGDIHSAKTLGDRNFKKYMVNPYARYLRLICRNNCCRTDSLVLHWPVWAKNPNWDFTLLKTDSIAQQQHDLRIIFWVRTCLQDACGYFERKFGVI